MKKCAIIANGYYHGDSYMDQINSITYELELLNVSVDRIYTDKLIAGISNSNVLSAVGNYDFIVFLDKDTYLSHMLEKAGYNLVNSARSIEVCDDKMKTYVVLSNNDINIPDTISAPLNYANIEDNFCLNAENLLGYPVVIKEVYGSMGKNVYLAKNRQELKAISVKLTHVPYLFQKFIGVGGADIRVILIGGKCVGAMKRQNNNDFRSNIELGGFGTKIQLTDDLIEICEKTASVLQLDYCGIDILQEGAKNYVCEVNSNAFFKGFKSVTGINVAKLYAQFLYEKFYGKN